MLYSILLIIALVIVGSFIFVNFHPVFGGSIAKTDYDKSQNKKDGVFVNQIETDMTLSFKDGLKLLPEYFSKPPSREPKVAFNTLKIDQKEIESRANQDPKLTWFGHSAFLLTMESKNILIDPMLGESASPITFIGSKRYSKDLPIQVDQLPEIDLVLFSHDHYDHLDYPTILKIKDKVKMFFVPLGLEKHLIRWGVAPENIRTFDWYDGTELYGIQFVCTPARHFSGRGLGDRFSTLWASWVIKSPSHSIYFSGDSGYAPHFKEIGEKYGPFDLALIECGQYNEKWDNIHMFPEQTVQAGVDVRAKSLMPIHWGAFTLALHPWTESVTRASQAAKNFDIEFRTPEIGRTISVKSDSSQVNYTQWWAAYQ